MFLLKFTNRNNEVYFFMNLGLNWGRGDNRRLIERTTEKRENARVFETEEAAQEVLVAAGEPAGWEIEPV